MAKIKGAKYLSSDFNLVVDDFEFPEEGVTVVWGANGSGKTTLLQILAGILECETLTFEVGRKLLSATPPRKRNLGYVFQDFALFPHLTAWENIIFPAEGRGIPLSEWQDQAKLLCRRLNIDRILQQRANTLSGGEKQRVALARALVTKPPMLMLDEPFSSLDEARRIEAQELIYDLSQEFKIPFLLVTHDLEDVRRLASHVLVLSKGQVVGGGPKEEILNSPKSLDLARLIPENLELRVKGEKGASSVLIYKPWSFEILSASDSHRGNFSGILTSVVDLGAHRECRVRLSDGQTLRCFSRLKMSELQSDREYQLYLDPSYVNLFKHEPLES